MLALCFAGCKSESEAAISDMADKQKEMVKILKGVTDKDSAVAAKPKLQALGKEMGEIATRMDKKKMDEAEMKKLGEKYKPQMEQTGKDLMAEMERIAKIPGAQEAISEAMMSMGSAMGMGAGMKP
jgi:repressor of nif and glnA expression